jgi:hypothetical protein
MLSGMRLFGGDVVASAAREIAIGLSEQTRPTIKPRRWQRNRVVLVLWFMWA